MKKTTKKSKVVVQGLLDYLSETKQTTLLPEVADNLTRLFQNSKTAKEIIVTSYLPLSSTEKEILRKAIQKILDVSLPVVNKVDKRLMGGFTIQVGDWFLDTTLRRELQSLKNTLLS